MSSVSGNEYLNRFLSAIDEAGEFKIDEVDGEFLDKRRDVALRSGEAAIRYFNALSSYVIDSPINKSLVFEEVQKSQISPLKEAPNMPLSRSSEMELNEILAAPWNKGLDGKNLNQEERKERIDFLIAHGYLNVANIDDETPLFYASTMGYIEDINVLIEAGANLNSVGRDGWTALHAAAYLGRMQVVNLLLDAKAHVDCPDIAGQTPLYLAAGNTHAGVVAALINAGANVDSKNLIEGTPLQLAVQHNQKEIVELLLHAKATVNHARKDGKTALSIAQENGYAQVVNILSTAIG
ncbi:MAG: ankyrin repeat domain-containing protein [Waddliaceae bacterium]